MRKGLLQLGNTLSVRVSDSLLLSRRRGWEQIGLVAPLAIGGEEGGPKGHRLEIGYSYCQRQETLELVRRLRENDKCGQGLGWGIQGGCQIQRSRV